MLPNTLKPLLIFSSIESTLHASEISAQARIVHVIGTTGFSIEQEEIIKAAARHATVIKSGNMSLGINILLGVVQNITKLVDDNWAIEISEIHHKEKKDHPSGTALALGASVAKGKKIDLEENKVIDDPIIDAGDINLTKIRKNVVRKKDDIGFSSYRKDGVIGDHSVIFSSENERIALTHIAKNRDIFANGALKAALWGQNKKPGLYSMQDVWDFERFEMSYLSLVRHGQSEWNEKNLFTGWENPGLTDKGIIEAENAGKKLNELKISYDHFYTSALDRAINTAEIIIKELNISNYSLIKCQELNERDYGDLTGLNKDDARKKWGDEQVYIWRRSYDVSPPNGESLKDTFERVIPFFSSKILSKLIKGQNIFISAHGNSLRSLIMHIENLSSEEILKREISTGEPLIYEFNQSAKFIL